MINFRFGLSERLFSAAMSLPAELILANRNLLFQFTKDTTEYEAKVKSHLERMGFKW